MLTTRINKDKNTYGLGLNFYSPNTCLNTKQNNKNKLLKNNKYNTNVCQPYYQKLLCFNDVGCRFGDYCTYIHNKELDKFWNNIKKYKVIEENLSKLGPSDLQIKNTNEKKLNEIIIDLSNSIRIVSDFCDLKFKKETKHFEIKNKIKEYIKLYKFSDTININDLYKELNKYLFIAFNKIDNLKDNSDSKIICKEIGRIFGVCNKGENCERGLCSKFGVCNFDFHSLDFEKKYGDIFKIIIETILYILDIKRKEKVKKFKLDVNDFPTIENSKLNNENDSVRSISSRSSNSCWSPDKIKKIPSFNNYEEIGVVQRKSPSNYSLRSQVSMSTLCYDFVNVQNKFNGNEYFDSVNIPDIFISFYLMWKDQTENIKDGIFCVSQNDKWKSFIKWDTKIFGDYYTKVGSDLKDGYNHETKLPDDIEFKQYFKYWDKIAAFFELPKEEDWRFTIPISNISDVSDIKGLFSSKIDPDQSFKMYKLIKSGQLGHLCYKNENSRKLYLDHIYNRRESDFRYNIGEWLINIDSYTLQIVVDCITNPELDYRYIKELKKIDNQNELKDTSGKYKKEVIALLDSKINATTFQKIKKFLDIDALFPWDAIEEVNKSNKYNSLNLEIEDSPFSRDQDWGIITMICCIIKKSSSNYNRKVSTSDIEQIKNEIKEYLIQEGGGWRIARNDLNRLIRNKIDNVILPTTDNEV